MVRLLMAALILMLLAGCVNDGMSQEELELEKERLALQREQLELEKAKLEQTQTPTTAPPATTEPPTTSTPVPSTDPVIAMAAPYVDPIETEDLGFRKRATTIVGYCPSGDKDCQVNAVFRYVVENFKYYADPRRDEFVQTPEETEDLMGGDCEDLTILLNTYLENLGIETYVVLTDTHAYSLACGVDTQRIFDYSFDSLSKLAARDLGQSQDAEIIGINNNLYLVEERSRTFSLSQGESYYYGGDGSSFQSPYVSMDIGYIVNSDQPLDLYFVPSREDFNALGAGNTFSHYPGCQRQDILVLSDECSDMDRQGGVVLVNGNFKSARVDLDLTYYYRLSFHEAFTEAYQGQEVTSYDLDGKTCIVLDATTGEYGYPGFEGNLVGDKVAVNTLTREYQYLA